MVDCAQANDSTCDRKERCRIRGSVRTVVDSFSGVAD